MSHNILITGAFGYLGGSLLANLQKANLPQYNKLYALVRTEEQANAVQKLYGAEPIYIDLKDETSTVRAIVGHEITIIYYLIDALHSSVQKIMIRALGDVKKKKTGRDVHFLHTTGAKIFSSHAGHPTDQPLLDTDPDYMKFKRERVRRSPCLGRYIFTPCVVYGNGEGFGNVISIQTTAIVKAAKRVRRVYSVDDDYAAWPVCHISDNTALYIELLRSILLARNPGYGKNGYYLAASGSITWKDIYSAMAKGLAKRNVIDDDDVVRADDSALEEMGKALDRPREFVPVELGGHCTFTARRGLQIGWKPQYPPEHILEVADQEVEWILQHL